MKKLRVYVDTSVFGGCFDEEFEEYSNQLYEMFQRGEIRPVVSYVVYRELETAPQKVRDKILQVFNPEIIGYELEPADLAELYIQEGIVTRKYFDDAMHIAIATCHRVDVLVSWNFKHIVNLNRIHKFNSINLREGYSVLEIRSPRDVIDNATDDE